MNCNHQFNLEGSKLYCPSCNSYWRGVQALETLVSQVNALQIKILNIEEYVIDQYTLALGKLGLEPCLCCGDFLLDKNLKRGWEPYHPQRKVVCDFGREGIHIRASGDCILCTSCLIQKLEESYFEIDQLSAIAFWVVHHFKDVRTPEVREKLEQPYLRIAQMVAFHVTDEMIRSMQV